MNDQKKWMLLSVPGALHRRVKSAAAKAGVTMQAFVLGLLDKKVEK